MDEKEKNVNYRAIYEKKKNENKNIPKILKEEIIKKRKNEVEPYGKHDYGWGYDYGGLLSCTTKTVDKVGDVTAFIIEDHYAVPKYGIRYSIDFGIIKRKKIYRYGMYIVRGGTPEGPDDFKRWYDEVKILEVKENEVIIGLKSSVLDIYKVDLKNGSIEQIERYDLEEERKMGEIKKLEEEVKKEESFEKQAEIIKKQIATKTGKNVEMKLFEKEKIAIYVVRYYDRDYDAAIKTLDFYAYKDGWNKSKLIDSHFLSYEDSIRYDYRFYTIEPSIKYGTPKEENGKISISVHVEVRFGKWEVNGGWSKTLKSEDFELKIE